MENEFYKVLNLFLKDMKSYSDSDIDNVIAGKSKFGIINKVMEKIQKEINKLPPEEIEKVLSGELKFGITKPKKNANQEIAIDYSGVIQRLEACNSRSEGQKILEQEYSKKGHLQVMAKMIDLEFKKNDKIPILIEKIVEATIGSRLKSEVFRSNYPPK